MTNWRLTAVAGVVMTAAVPVAAPAAPRPVWLMANDRLAVAGSFHPAEQPRATILLFHQAGSSKGEYASIAPRLAALGFDALAIDQRVGGPMFGRNETAAQVKGQPGYVDAQRDLEAAFAWASRRGRPVILWGSSYSAALVFRVAAQHPGKVAALLAFSPGEYLETGPSVAAAAARISVPVFVTSTRDPTEIAAARKILAAVPTRTKTQHVPQAGVHGSSTPNAVRNPRGAAANWAAVRAFLSRVVG
jgi:dienelactone hydrolase